MRQLAATVGFEETAYFGYRLTYVVHLAKPARVELALRSWVNNSNPMLYGVDTANLRHPRRLGNTDDTDCTDFSLIKYCIIRVNPCDPPNPCAIRRNTDLTD